MRIERELEALVRTQLSLESGQGHAGGDRHALTLRAAIAEFRDLLADIHAHLTEDDATQLFDASEDRGLNLDSRLKRIRDLCSASIPELRMLARSEGLPKPGQADVNGDEGRVLEWSQFFEARAAHASSSEWEEGARLMDDVAESLATVVALLNARDNRPIWNEVYRNVTHVRDHYDHAENSIIGLMKPNRSVD